jgi:hypothetical protein
MTIPFNSSGVPKGTGSLQIRGRVYWMIYSDETGRKIQANTETDDFTEARRVLARAAIAVLQARLAALGEILREAPAKATGVRSDDPAIGDSRRRANRKSSARAARTGRTNPRPVGTRGTRKGEAA